MSQIRSLGKQQWVSQQWNAKPDPKGRTFCVQTWHVGGFLGPSLSKCLYCCCCCCGMLDSIWSFWFCCFTLFMILPRFKDWRLWLPNSFRCPRSFEVSFMLMSLLPFALVMDPMCHLNRLRNHHKSNKLPMHHFANWQSQKNQLPESPRCQPYQPYHWQLSYCVSNWQSFCNRQFSPELTLSGELHGTVQQTRCSFILTVVAKWNKTNKCS